jgi:nicotinamidase-related amidase
MAEASLTTFRYSWQSTALVVVDPYKDFFAPFGRAWPMTRDVTLRFDVVRNLGRAMQGFRAAGARVVFAPHQRHRLGVPSHRRHPAPPHVLARAMRLFSATGRGGEFHPRLAPERGELVATEHATSCAFTGTNLERVLRMWGVRDIVLGGALSNTCVEATGRTARDLGYRVTFLRDAVTAMTPRDHEAALLDYRAIGAVSYVEEALCRLDA